MHIHRTSHQRFFTTLGNEILRDNRLSFCARGILCHLLSLPDGQRGDIRTLADRTPEGRERVASALRELENFGYLRRVKKQTPEGRIYTKVDLFENPNEASLQATPNPEIPDPDELSFGSDGGHHVNELDEETTRPSPSAEAVETGREGDDAEEAKTSAELLARVARTEPKLSLGVNEAMRLAPLVTEWRQRGVSDLHVINSLTAGLPRNGVYHPAKFIETRLRSKMPAERRLAPAPLECDGCSGPVAVSGLCRSCREVEPVKTRALTDFASVRARGAALARATLRGVSNDGLMPALA